MTAFKNFFADLYVVFLMAVLCVLGLLYVFRWPLAVITTAALLAKVM